MVLKPLHEAGALIGYQVGRRALDGRGRPRLVHVPKSTRAGATPPGPRRVRRTGPAGISRSPFQCPAQPGPAQEPALEEQEADDRDETGDQHCGEEHPELRLALDRRQANR